ncbi:hypothetical protein TrST_g10710 [Triparma strigata]|uniref:WW domain-containing protein n=1 Tax=Triparma strigata TaxID=1606541 RepID=A0A9W7AE03_9STRA|nr:hypothetical protein TrST_g10710 [Triparma strigata]
MSRGKSEGVEDEEGWEEGGVQLVEMKKNTTVLGAAADPGTGKSKSKRKSKVKSGGVIMPKNPIISRAAQKRSQFMKTSSVTSSFSGNEDVWIEHKSEEGGRKGETYYHQPSTGKTVWERPEGGGGAV